MVRLGALPNLRGSESLRSDHRSLALEKTKTKVIISGTKFLLEFKVQLSTAADCGWHGSTSTTLLKTEKLAIGC